MDAIHSARTPEGHRFFLDDLHNLSAPSRDSVALALRDQFHSFAIDNINCSVCFPAPLNYFSNIRSLAEPTLQTMELVSAEGIEPSTYCFWISNP
jgi:hypothetical protein